MAVKLLPRLACFSVEFQGLEQRRRRCALSRLLIIRAHNPPIVLGSISRLKMRALRLPAIVAGVVLAMIGWIEGVRSASNLHLACNDFPPHKIEHPAVGGQPGFDIDIVSEALNRIGFSADISFLPWKRALELAGRGEYDGLCSCSYSYTKDREDKLLFSEELGAVSVGLFARSADALAGASSIADLKDRKVATIGGYNLEAELTKAGAVVDATSSDKAALDMLVGGNVDVLYAYQLTTEHFIRSDPRSASIVYKEIRRNPYYFCLSRAMPGADAVMQGFNRSIAGMVDDGSIARILNAYHVQFR
jgi:polar amino acid transport system substrate-binding protein